MNWNSQEGMHGRSWGVGKEGGDMLELYYNFKNNTLGKKVNVEIFNVFTFIKENLFKIISSKFLCFVLTLVHSSHM